MEPIGLEASDFEDELGITVIHHTDLSIGRLALVAITEAATYTENRLRQSCTGGLSIRTHCGDQPAGFIHLVDTLVADVAVTKIPKPMPVVVDQILMVRLLRRRA